MLQRKPTNLSLLILRRPKSPISDGQLLRRSSAELRTPREPPRRCSMSMYVLLHSSLPSRFYHSHRKPSFTLPHPNSRRPKQQTMPLRPANDCADDNRFFSLSESVDLKELGSVCQVIDELFIYDEDMEVALDERETVVSHDLVIAVLERFKNARRPAFRFFIWAGKKPGFAHDSRTYNAMMAVFANTRQFQSLLSMIEEMGEKKLLTIDTFVIAIKAFGLAREKKKAVMMFFLMDKHGFDANVGTFNVLLNTLVRKSQLDVAKRVFERFRKRFPPDSQTYTVLLGGWFKVKNLLEASKVWNDMIESEIVPDVTAHNVMLEGLLNAWKSLDAEKFFTLMKEKGPKPNVATYAILVRDFCRRRKSERAIRYYDEMIRNGVRPDEVVYTCLINGFAAQGQMGTAMSLLREMNEKGFPPDERLYDSLIKLMTVRRSPEDAMRVFERMVESGVKPTVRTYNLLMKSFFEDGDFEKGRSAWEDMARQGIEPNENSYNIFVGGLVSKKMTGETCRLIVEMMDKGMKAPVIDYKMFAKDCSEKEDISVLEDMARRMKSFGKFGVSTIFANRIDRVTEKELKRSNIGSWWSPPQEKKKRSFRGPKRLKTWPPKFT